MLSVFSLLVKELMDNALRNTNGSVLSEMGSLDLFERDFGLEEISLLLFVTVVLLCYIQTTLNKRKPITCHGSH